MNNSFKDYLVDDITQAYYDGTNGHVTQILEMGNYGFIFGWYTANMHHYLFKHYLYILAEDG